MHTGGYGDRGGGYGDRDRGYGDRDRGYGDRDRGGGYDRGRDRRDDDRGRWVPGSASLGAWLARLTLQRLNRLVRVVAIVGGFRRQIHGLCRHVMDTVSSCGLQAAEEHLLFCRVLCRERDRDEPRRRDRSRSRDDRRDK